MATWYIARHICSSVSCQSLQSFTNSIQSETTVTGQMLLLQLASIPTLTFQHVSDDDDLAVSQQQEQLPYQP